MGITRILLEGGKIWKGKSLGKWKATSNQGKEGRACPKLGHPAQTSELLNYANKKSVEQGLDQPPDSAPRKYQGNIKISVD